MTFVSYLESEIGFLRILSNGKGITGIKFMDTDGPEDPDIHTESAKTQLREYFANQRNQFDLNLLPEGTSFEKEVWNMLLQIPSGNTKTYGEIAKELGDKNFSQAVGHANGKNPIAVIIPCHRVIGAKNNLVGYAGGIERKQWLLKHEGALLL